MRSFKTICESGGEQNGGDLDRSVKEISDLNYLIFNQRQRFDCKGYFKLIIVKW
ncbi:hypothetical protein [Helicobacter pylori]|uniref:hypothetical protein n=1 Tax=Helicobacter pylori TaxID=210 RepID=UPI0013CE0B0D|nr:hypothetical protein [Helicobacter pylori]